MSKCNHVLKNLPFDLLVLVEKIPVTLNTEGCGRLPGEPKKSGAPESRKNKI